MKKIFLMILTVFLISFCCQYAYAADYNEEEKDYSEIYEQQFKDSGIEDLYDVLDETAKNYLSDVDISDINYDWTTKLSAENIFHELYMFLKSGCKKPFVSMFTVVGVLLIYSISSGYLTQKLNEKTTDFCVTAIVGVAIALPVCGTITGYITSLKVAGTFMTGFIPVFSGILFASGKTVVSAGFSSVMIIAIEVMVASITTLVIPFVGIQLSFGICGSVSPLKTEAFGNFFKKTSTWVLGFMTTIFLGLLSMQTAIGSATDSLSNKALRMMAGSWVPVFGNAISESLLMVQGCMSVLKTSVAIYAVLAITAILVPLLFEIILWRFSLWASSALSEILGAKKINSLLKAFDSVFGFILGTVMFESLLFIIALTIVLTVGK